MKNQVLVYDDDENFVDNCVERLQNLRIFTKNFKADPVRRENFEKMMETLENRQRTFRRGGKWENESFELDETSILIVDYDLLMAFKSKSFITSNVVAYLARCFSKCGLIIGMNIDGDNPFDLTLKGHLDSFCDLNIGSRQLDNPGLWGKKAKGFRPWYWPQLPKYLESFQKKVDDVKENLGEPICKVLGIEDVIRIFPRSVSEFLGSDPVTTTFRKFVTESGNGLKRKDKNPNNELVARIAAARVSKWLERRVLPGQDMLVDAPHLVSRYPSLLRGDHSKIGTWNKTALFDEVESLGLKHEIIEEFRFKKDFWLSRPGWFWGKLSDCQKIEEVAEPWKREEPDFVFCEDTSSFHEREECKEFVADLDSPYIRRFVYCKDFEDIKYKPGERLVESRVHPTRN